MSIRSLPALLAAAAIVFLGVSVAPSQELDTEPIWQFAATQLAATEAAVPAGNYPLAVGDDGQWYYKTPAWYVWDAGFYPQCLWALYEHTGSAQWLSLAQTRTMGLWGQQWDDGGADQSFIVFNSFGYGYKLTGDATYKSAVLDAAATKATLYSPIVGAIRSWWFVDPYWVTIDNMMNIEILFWSAANGGPQSHYDIAFQHALTTRREHIRPDGSHFHVVDYYPDTGAVESRHTVQGLADDSTWSRGQAWAIHGFTTTYRYTGDARFLDTAQQAADWFLDHLPADNIPYWDFDAPAHPSTARDTSAAAVAASGLIELSSYCTGETRTRYFDAAEDILKACVSPGYYAQGTSEPSILLRGTRHHPADKDIDTGLIWGDSYFLEAVIRYEDALAALPAGDADRDGDVDLADFVILKNNFGTPAGADRTTGDFNEDGKVDLADFVILKNNFGASP